MIWEVLSMDILDNFQEDIQVSGECSRKFREIFQKTFGECFEWFWGMLEKIEKLRQGNFDFVSKIKAEDLMMGMFSKKLVSSGKTAKL